MAIRLLMVLATLPVASLFIYAGVEWIYVGYGLHPLAAFPLAIVSLLAPVCMYEIALEELYQEIDELELECDLNLARQFDLESRN